MVQMKMLKVGKSMTYECIPEIIGKIKSEQVVTIIDLNGKVKRKTNDKRAGSMEKVNKMIIGIE